MYAVVRTGGKQYRVQEGRAITIERLPGEAGDTVELGEVLLMADGDEITVGAPSIEGARIVGTIAEQGRAKKIIVFRYKNKTRSRKKTGHRQHFTRLMVEDILAPGQERKAKAEAAAPAAETVEEKPAKGRRARKAAVATPFVAEAAAPAADAKLATPEAAVDAPAAKPKRSRKKAE